MKKQLQKKVYAILIMMIVCVTVSNAQIIYTDLDPDVVIPQSSYNNSQLGVYTIDFNNDGIIDLGLKARYINRALGGPPNGSGDVLASTSVTPPSELLTSFSTVTWGLNLDANSLIEDASQTWSNSTARLDNNNSCASYCWPLNVNRFIGVRFSVGGDWFYGWVRLSISLSNTSSSCTVRDYAYNSLPNQPILAGQTSSLGINENPLASKINIFPNPTSNQLTISLGKVQPEVEVSITDITGKTVYKIKESERQNIEINTTDFASGIYLVQIKTTDFIETKKLIVKK
jgi:hypothetical protein